MGTGLYRSGVPLRWGKSMNRYGYGSQAFRCIGVLFVSFGFDASYYMRGATEVVMGFEFTHCTAADTRSEPQGRVAQGDVHCIRQ